MSSADILHVNQTRLGWSHAASAGTGQKKKKARLKSARVQSRRHRSRADLGRPQPVFGVLFRHQHVWAKYRAGNVSMK